MLTDGTVFDEAASFDTKIGVGAVIGPARDSAPRICFWSPKNSIYDCKTSAQHIPISWA
jgi:hypothetical protein